MLLCMLIMEHNKRKEFNYKPSAQITMSNDVQISLSEEFAMCGWLANWRVYEALNYVTLSWI